MTDFGGVLTKENGLPLATPPPLPSNELPPKENLLQPGSQLLPKELARKEMHESEAPRMETEEKEAYATPAKHYSRHVYTVGGGFVGKFCCCGLQWVTKHYS